MVGSVERIEQEIVALNEATRAIADEFYNAYSAYLTVLGQAVRQQIILVSYHVCTQGYPESFLRLSYSSRQQLQQMLRSLAQQVQEEILAQLHLPVVVDDPDRVDDPDADPAALTRSTATNEQAAFDHFLDTPTQPQSLTPVHLAQWREELEHAIVTELKTASHAANRLLQQAGILPQRLPEPILEAATKADLSERAGTPNLLNLLVEAHNENVTEEYDVDNDPSNNHASNNHASSNHTAEEPSGHSVMHIVAIYLRLVEIEFADPTVTAARSKIRSLFARLKILGREYQKKQREQAIAEAQAAWRSSWTEN